MRAAPAPAVALIGLGGYGQTHRRFLQACAAAGACRIVSAVAIADTAPADRAALAGPGVRIYPTFDEWLAAERGRFDLCCLPTPIHLHAAMTLAALAAGGSVLVEKPLAASRPEIARLLAARPAAGRFAAVGFQDLYLPAAHTLKAALLAGRHGRLQRIRLLGQWPRADAYYARNTWAGRLRVPGGAVLDSPLNNAFAHFLMLALFLAGEAPLEATTVTGGAAELYRARPIESFDTAFARLSTRAGVEITCAMSHSGRENATPVIALDTDRACLAWRVWEKLVIDPRPGAAGRSETHPLPGMDATRLGFFRQVCQRARGEEVFVCTPRLAAAHAAGIVDLHAGAPIHDVPAAQLETVECAGERTGTITGIDDLLHRSFATGLLPAELDTGWASPATTFAAPCSAWLRASAPFGNPGPKSSPDEPPASSDP